ncbi:MAG: metal-sensing transcriptional repressor [Candidatus Poribacteria bacterium]|nr:metal-sensing transcriptional repressor [Candidatus Poribacteria bacterium]
MAEHDHGDGTPTHDHPHTHRRRPQVIARLARIEGHIRSIRQMVESDRDCSEVLIQIAAVRSAIQNAGKVILEDHFESCIVSAAARGDHDEAIEEFKEAFSKLVY